MKKEFIILGLFLTGCGIPYQNRVKTEGREFIEEYPGNEATIYRAIKEKRIVPGMTMEEVVLSRGNPSSKEDIMIGQENYEKWVYETREKEKLINRDFLYFRKGILIFWED